ncbi:hypothetical protein [Sinomonas mesophila]|uniref:hypothetical protein n=1 Tax=Sinomonas mesophila TaxID=1531955 RepID=UPI00098690B5|nr:hypothetical protein [Sinomonas mesophila]
MFKDIYLQEPRVLPLNGETFRHVVEDRDRDCRLYGLGAYNYGSRWGHVLQAGDKYVPFDTYSEQYSENGEERAIVYFYSFGWSKLGEKRRIPDFEFGSEEEKDRLRRIAAEAVLVEATWPAPTSPEQVRVSLGGELLTLRDFGYGPKH